MYYVYILYSSKLAKFYTGLTEDVDRRLQEHNSKGVPFTSRGVPWKLVYYESFLDKQDATSEELFLKSGKGRERRAYMLKNYLASLKN